MLTITRHFRRSGLRLLALVILAGIILSHTCYGQADSGKMFMNTIRVNVSNPMLFGWKFNVIGYERVITDHQSASISFGRTAFPKFSIPDGDSLGITNQSDDNGVNMSLDYRFYLKNENKHRAPRGIYLGPYYAFNTFSRNVTWDLNTSTYTGSVNTDVKLGAHLMGVQMGVQFILWKRLAIDMIMMGPGWWYFSLKSSFDTTLSSEDESELLEKLNEMLKEKFPGSDLVLQGGDFEAKRSAWTSTAGFRYMINLGFRF